MKIPDWSIILFDLNDRPVMDISKLVSFTLDLKLNDISTLTFDINLVKFEQLCSSINVLPRNILYPTKFIKVYRNNYIKFGGIISECNASFDKNTMKLSVSADSWLQYFAKRLLSKTYSSTDRSQIAWDAINTAQSVSNGSIGITQGNLATTYNSDLTADYQSIKDIIINYTKYAPVPYDFEITPDKVFNTYIQGSLGNIRNDVVLEFPNNIIKCSVPRGSDSLYNKVIGIGSGIGSARLQSIKENTTSQLTYLLSEKKQLYNSVSEQTTLDNNTQGYLDDSLDVLELPTITVDGKDVPLDVLMPGDTIKVRIKRYSYCNDVDGSYRINELSISVDSNSHEEVAITFYNPNAAGSIEQEE